ncbi:hypothetical protein FRB94_003254 [Tulasnella sp. JGI-2019a]|nr:hypothetical protein FRB94_003254 [Tulasnella sp. JGI-2019a]
MSRSEQHDPVTTARKRLDEELEGLGAVRIDISRLSINRDVILGKGGYGTVFLGRLRSEKSAGGSQVAVKQLRSDETQDLRVAVRLTKEMKAWCQLRHNNILPLLGFYLSEKLDVALIISPYVSLGDVPNYLNGRTVDFMKRLDLCLDALSGLMYLHDQGYCHGDIKPANLLVNSAAKAMLTDFGLVKAVTQDTGHISSTSSGFKGSIRYSSPEVLDGKPRSTSSDMWAFGCTVMEITTGSHPYPFAIGDTSIIASILWKKETPDQGIPLPGTVDLWVVLRGCWHVEAIDRVTASECIAKYYIMLATHYTPGVLEGAAAGPAYEGGQQPWQRILKQLAATPEPKAISDTLHVSRWKAAAALGIENWEGTKTDPVTSLPKLAKSLQIISQDISNLGRAEEGMILQQEACTIFRALTVQGHPENQTYLIEGLCRTCTLAMEMKMAGEAFRAITEAVDIRCRDLYAFQAVQAMRECLVQLDTCVTKLDLYEEGSAYIKNKVVALRASVKGLSVGRGKAPLTSYREVMALRDKVSGGSSGRRRLHKVTRAMPSIGTVQGSKSQSSLAASTIAWDTQSTTSGVTLTSEAPKAEEPVLLSRQNTGSSSIGYGYQSYSTLSLSTQRAGASTLSLANDNNLLEYVRIIAFSLQLRGSYLQKLGKEDEAAETMNEAVHIYIKISSPGQSPSNPPRVDIAPPLYKLASELFDMQRLAESRTAVEEAIRIYTFHVLHNAEYTESMDMCRKLLDDVKKGLKRGGNRSKSEEETSQGSVLRKPSAAATLAREKKAATAQADWEDAWGLDVDRLDSKTTTKEDTKGGGSPIEPYVWKPSPQSQRHSRDAPPRTTERGFDSDTVPPLRRSNSSQLSRRSVSGRGVANRGGPGRSSSEDVHEERPWPTLRELEGNPYGRYPNIEDDFRPNTQEQALPEEVGSDRRRQDRWEGRSLRSARGERTMDAPQERGNRRDNGRDALDKTSSQTGHVERSMSRGQEDKRLVDGRRQPLRDDESYGRPDPVEASMWDESESVRADSSSHASATVPGGLPEWEMPSESDVSFNPWVHGQEIVAQQGPAESTANRAKAHPTDSSTSRLSRRSVRAVAPDRRPLDNVAESDESKEDLTPKRKAPSKPHAKPQSRGAEQSILEKELPAPPPEDDTDDWGHPIAARKRKRASLRLLFGDLIPTSRDQPTGGGTAAKRGFFGRLLERFKQLELA